ncbi:MAG: hypothetical protein AAFR71_01085 [Pseudomonadota bacterium]
MFGEHLDTTTIKDRINHRFGSVRRLADAWTIQFGEDTVTTDAIYYWLRTGKPPGSFVQLMRLSQLLGLDPTCLFKSNPQLKAAHIDKLLRAAITKVFHVSLLSDDFFDVFGPQSMWPNNPKLQALGLDRWYARDFRHDGSRLNYYQTVELKPTTTERPVVWYFAYCPIPSDVWRVYGSVQTDANGTTSLNNFYKSGLFTSHRFSDGTIDVSTLFGGSACDFRVVSMHPFSLQLVDRDEVELRFLV